MPYADIQAAIYNGLAVAANVLGTPFDVYRPTGPFNPLAVGNKVATLLASFTSHGGSNYNYGKPSDHKDALYHGMFDAAQTRIGDFLKSALGTYVIISQDPLQPPLVVGCSRVLNFTRSLGETTIGLGGYGGNVIATELQMMTAWPTSVIEQGSSKSASGASLPGDGGALRWDMLTAAYPGVQLRVSDYAVDEYGNRYVLGGAELSDLGWRLKATQAVV